MKIPICLAFAMLLSSCSLLNEDEDVSIDCEADPFATDCQDGQRLGCNASGEVVAESCGAALTCERLSVGGTQQAVCAPDCNMGSTAKVCAGDLLLECQGNSVNATSCSPLGCMELPGMGAECQ